MDLTVKAPAPERSTNHYASDLVEQIGRMKQGIYLDELTGARPLELLCRKGHELPEEAFYGAKPKTRPLLSKTKVDLGAEYIGTQMFFDNNKVF